MPLSRLQEPFMKDIAASFKATQVRIIQRLGKASPNATAAIVEEELRGLFHGRFVTFDGGTALADEGLIRITDEEGLEFERFLHETCFDFWKS